jgi:hypothetical protein
MGKTFGKAIFVRRSARRWAGIGDAGVTEAQHDGVSAVPNAKRILKDSSKELNWGGNA